MLSEITLRNFQSHLDSKLEFHSGLNAIIGTSMEGKSAIMRGFDWCIKNSLRGFGFRSSFADKKKETKVTIKTSEGNAVTRYRRGTSAGGYLVNGHKFEAISSEVPDMVHEALNMDELNCQGQEDGRFMLAKEISPGEVAKRLNAFVGLSIIDRITAKINGLLDKEQTRKRELDKDIEQNQQDIESLSFLDSAKVFVDSILIKKEKVRVNNVKVIDIENLINTIASLEFKKINLNNLISSESTILSLQAKIDRWVSISQKIKSIEDLLNSIAFLNQKKTSLEMLKAQEPKVIALQDKISRWQILMQRIRTQEDLLNKINYLKETNDRNYKLIKADFEIDKISKKLGLLSNLSLKRQTIENVLMHIDRLLNARNEKESMILSVKKKYADLLKSARICPTCLEPINETQIEKHLAEI